MLILRFFAVAALLFAACQSSPEETATGTADSLAVPRTEETPAEAIIRLSQLIRDNPRDYGLLQERAQVYYSMDSLFQAVRDVERALSLYPQSPDLHYLRGLFAKQAGDSVQAMASFVQAVGMGTKDPEVHYELGQQYFFRKDYPKALQAYQQAAQLAPNDPQYVFAQGFLEEQRGQPSKALSLYRKSLEVDSLFVKALTQLHDLYFETFGSVKEAALYNDRLLRYYPFHPLGQYQRGSRALSTAMKANRETEMEKFSEAINAAAEAFTLAINTDTAFVDAYFSRGFTYLLGGQRVDLATRDFERCLALQPAYPQAHFWLGSIQEKYQDYASALKHYEQALAGMPDNQDFRDAVRDMQSKLR